MGGGVPGFCCGNSTGNRSVGQPTCGGGWGSACKVLRGPPTPVSSACLPHREVYIRCQLCPTSGKPYPPRVRVEDPLLENGSEGALCSSLPKKPGRPSWEDTRDATFGTLPGSYTLIIVLFSNGHKTNLECFWEACHSNGLCQ